MDDREAPGATGPLQGCRNSRGVPALRQHFPAPVRRWPGHDARARTRGRQRPTRLEGQNGGALRSRPRPGATFGQMSPNIIRAARRFPRRFRAGLQRTGAAASARAQRANDGRVERRIEDDEAGRRAAKVNHAQRGRLRRLIATSSAHGKCHRPDSAPRPNDRRVDQAAGGSRATGRGDVFPITIATERDDQRPESPRAEGTGRIVREEDVPPRNRPSQGRWGPAGCERLRSRFWRPAGIVAARSRCRGNRIRDRDRPRTAEREDEATADGLSLIEWREGAASPLDGEGHLGLMRPLPFEPNSAGRFAR